VLDAPPDDAPYRDPSLSVQARVEDLIGRMTLDEKVGQLVGVPVGGATEAVRLETMREPIRTHGLGHATSFGDLLSPFDAPAEAAKAGNDLQRVAVEETRLGIPLLLQISEFHGHATVQRGTVFPHNIGVAATRDPGQARRVPLAPGEVGTASVRVDASTLAVPQPDGRRATEPGTFELFVNGRATTLEVERHGGA
jgi:hypothetical protein